MTAPLRSKLLGSLCTALLVLSATRALSADAPFILSGYSITSWTDSDGLPLGGVYSIVQDSDGYLWIGTTAGLLRFDGVRFTQWNDIGSTSLPASPVSAVALGSDGSLWIGLSNGGGVYRISHALAVRVDAKAHVRGTITALAEDAAKTIWAVADGTLLRLSDNGESRAFEPATAEESFTRGRVRSLSTTRSGALLVGTVDGLFRKMDDGSFKRTADGWVWSVSEDAGGTLWITDTMLGYRRLTDPPGRQIGRELNGYRLKHDRSGDLWVATIGEGLWRVRAGHGNVAEKAPLATGLLNDSVQSLFEDGEDNLWVGSTVGLHRITRQKATPVTNIGLAVTAEQTGTGDIWVGTNYGLARSRSVDGKWQTRRWPSPNIYVRSLYRDDGGVLWIGANEGLFRLYESGLRRVPLPTPFEASPVMSIASDHHGGLLLSDGLRTFDWQNGSLRALTLPANAPAGTIDVSHLDRHGRLWLAFHSGSLGALEPNGRLRVYGSNELGSTALVITSIMEDPTRDVIWAATSAGILRIAAGTTDRPVTRALPGIRVWSLVQDDSSHIWANVDLGVIRFSPEEFERGLGGNQPNQLHYDLLDPTDGLAGAPILNLRSGRNSDGKLWFIRGGALSIVDPHELSEWPVAHFPIVRVERAANEVKPFSVDQPTVFPAGTRRIELNYTAIALTSPQRLRFRYHLDGFDRDWVNAGTSRSASYTNLPPGDYVFRVAASMEDGSWQAAPTVWAFSIRPTIIQTRWFYAVSALVLALAIWGAWRFRVGLVRHQYAMVLSERARMSREIHDTLLQSFVGLAMHLDALADSLDGVSQSAQHTALRMRRQVEASIREARQSIWNLRSPILETHDLPGALRKAAEDVTDGMPIRVVLTTDGELRRLPGRLENELLRIAQEAVTNTVRHAEASRIEIELRFAPDSVALRISDDGRGMGEEATLDRESHFGIISMKERAESLGGRFTVGSPAGGGTRVEAVLPVTVAA